MCGSTCGDAVVRWRLLPTPVACPAAFLLPTWRSLAARCLVGPYPRPVLLVQSSQLPASRGANPFDNALDYLSEDATLAELRHETAGFLREVSSNPPSNYS